MRTPKNKKELDIDKMAKDIQKAVKEHHDKVWPRRKNRVETIDIDYEDVTVTLIDNKHGQRTAN